MERNAMRRGELHSLTKFGSADILNGAMDGADVLDRQKRLKRIV